MPTGNWLAQTSVYSAAPAGTPGGTRVLRAAPAPRTRRSTRPARAAVPPRQDTERMRRGLPPHNNSAQQLCATTPPIRPGRIRLPPQLFAQVIYKPLDSVEPAYSRCGALVSGLGIKNAPATCLGAGKLPSPRGPLHSVPGHRAYRWLMHGCDCSGNESSAGPFSRPPAAILLATGGVLRTTPRRRCDLPGSLRKRRFRNLPAISADHRKCRNNYYTSASSAVRRARDAWPSITGESRLPSMPCHLRRKDLAMNY